MNRAPAIKLRREPRTTPSRMPMEKPSVHGSQFDRALKLLGLDEPRDKQRTGCHLTALCGCIALPAVVWIEAHVIDISSDGLSLLTEKYVEPGRFLAVLFPSPRALFPPPSLMKVIHVRPFSRYAHQIGGAWIHKKSAEQLQRLLDSSLPSPNLS